MDAQQRSMAVRSFIKASVSAPPEPDNLDRFLQTVDKLTEWDDKHGAQDLVKTVSRMVQSFERTALSSILGLLMQPMCRSYRAPVQLLIDPQFIITEAAAAGGGQEGQKASITSVACTLRRSDRVFHLFAATVATEIIWAEATNGSRNTTQHLCRQMEERRKDAGLMLLRELALLKTDDLPHDTLGLPLMQINASMCVCRGVLVVMPGSTSATYILDIAEGVQDLSNVRNITITRVLDEPIPKENKKRRAAPAQ